MNARSSILVSFFFAAALLLSSCGNSGERGVHSSFKKYQSALVKKDGKAVGALVTASSVDYYGDVLNHALKSPEADVKALGLIKRMMVLQTRHSATLDELQPLSPSEFLGFMTVNLDSGSGMHQALNSAKFLCLGMPRRQLFL